MNESWMQVLALFLANAGLVLWFRSESRNDWRHMDAKMDANQKETNQIIRAIHEDIKDFHGRLIKIEEARKS